MTILRIPALVLLLSIIGLSASPALAGVVAPPQPGGLTGTVQFSCAGPRAEPTVTVVVHNAYDDQFGLSVWADDQVVGHLSVPGHTTRQATFADPAWEDSTVEVQVVRIGLVVVASGTHHFDCRRDLVVVGVGTSPHVSVGSPHG